MTRISVAGVHASEEGRGNDEEADAILLCIYRKSEIQEHR